MFSFFCLYSQNYKTQWFGEALVTLANVEFPMHNWLGTLVPINHCWVDSNTLINQLLQPFWRQASLDFISKPRKVPQIFRAVQRWDDEIKFLRNYWFLSHSLFAYLPLSFRKWKRNENLWKKWYSLLIMLKSVAILRDKVYNRYVERWFVATQVTLFT